MLKRLNEIINERISNDLNLIDYKGAHKIVLINIDNDNICADWLIDSWITALKSLMSLYNLGLFTRYSVS